MKIDRYLHGIFLRISETNLICGSIGMSKQIETKIERFEQEIARKLFEKMEPLMDAYVKRLILILTPKERLQVSNYLKSLAREELSNRDFLLESDDSEIQEILMKINVDEEAVRIYKELNPFMDIARKVHVGVDW